MFNCLNSDEDKNEAGLSNVIQVRNSSAEIGVWDAAGTLRTFSFASVMTSGDWYIVTVTISDTLGARCYLNGVESTTGEITISTGLDLDQIGAYGDSIGNPWDDELDAIKIFDGSTLTATQAALLAKYELAGYRRAA